MAIKYYRIPEHTDDWYNFRTTGIYDHKKYGTFEGGIGGSEVSVVFNAVTDEVFNPYMSGARLFHQKVGTVQSVKQDREVMFHGREQEEYLSKLWQYWDGDVESMMENYKSGNVVRRCERVNGYAVNDKYPWLFASLDRRIVAKGGYKMDEERTPLTKSCPLELKTLSYHAAKLWKNRIPEYYFFQVYMYMIVFEVDYAEIAVFKDGNQFDVIPVYKDIRLADQIIEITKHFWYEMVLPARKYARELDTAVVNRDEDAAQRAKYALDKLEPEPDNTEDYSDLIEERFKGGVDQVKGSHRAHDLAKEDECLRAYSKVIKKRRQMIQNIIKKEMDDNDSQELTFNDGEGNKSGYVTYRARKGAEKRTFSINIRKKPDDNMIKVNFDEFRIKEYKVEEE